MIAGEIATDARCARLRLCPGIERTVGLDAASAMSQVVLVPRLFASIIACLFLLLAVVGVMLPGLPTVPFLLLAAWFSARGSERLHKWLYAHPQLGRLLIDWETQKAISRKSKVVAVLMLLASWVVMYRQVSSAWILAGITLLFASVATYLVTRREPG
jgi:hypothetical protein